MNDHLPTPIALFPEASPHQAQTKQDFQNPRLFARTVISSLFPANPNSPFDLQLEVISSGKLPLAPSMCYYSNLYLPVFIQPFANAL